MKHDLLGVVMTRGVSMVISSHRSNTLIFRCVILKSSKSEIQFQTSRNQEAGDYKEFKCLRKLSQK